ncbi:MAG: hypothetical protein QM696_07975 [Steroidobacteraceae bacterium]
MTLPALATLLLCLFGSLLIAARPSGRAVWAAVTAFAVGGALAILLRPASSLLAISAGILCAVSLLRALPREVPAVLSGLCAGLGVVGLFSLAEYGFAAVGVWLVGLAVPVATLRFKARQPGFAPAALIDQGQCAVVIAAPVVAALPGAEEGWRSALALAGAQPATSGTSPGAWLLLPLAALVAGMLYQTWSQR